MLVHVHCGERAAKLLLDLDRRIVVVYHRNVLSGVRLGI